MGPAKDETAISDKLHPHLHLHPHALHNANNRQRSTVWVRSQSQSLMRTPRRMRLSQARCSKTSCCTSWLTYEQGHINIAAIAACTSGSCAVYSQSIHDMHYNTSPNTGARSATHAIHTVSAFVSVGKWTPMMGTDVVPLQHSW